MSDTIRNEEKYIWRKRLVSDVSFFDVSCFNADLSSFTLRLLDALEHAEDRAKDNSDALTAAYMSGKYDGRKEAEARATKLKADIDAGAKDYSALMDRHDAQFVRAEKAEAENARLRKRLEAALDKIADIEEDSNAHTSEGVCHACGICADCPQDWQPTDDHCCRVMLEMWAEGEPLPWEASHRAVAAGEETCQK